jgi:ABC-type uncharacterized transport system auxiliary subunit
MKNVFQFVLTFLLAAMTASCGATRPSKFYSLEVPAASAAQQRSLPVAVLVGRVTAPHVLRDDRIAYRTAATQIGMYEYHRWAEPPATMIEALLVRRLRAEGRYKSVQALSSNAEGDYILRGRLYQFEEVSGGAGLAARISLEMELFEKKSGTVVWTHLFQAEETVAVREVPAVVDALNRGAQKVFDQVAAGVSSYFTQQAPK